MLQAHIMRTELDSLYFVVVVFINIVIFITVDIIIIFTVLGIGGGVSVLMINYKKCLGVFDH